ncbi:MAG: right-handed parallel beta-helix repeat-containing protein [Candidatus Eisenbacteria bacterium]|nr:right-handed parallel beta-helix repeat-containing protein [Candidatus Eisenbacteria bacterium]
MRTRCHCGLSSPPSISLVFVLLVFTPVVTGGATLQSVYESAPRQLGYDRYLDLRSGTTYTGGIAIPDGGSVCIKGNGAIIDLEGSIIAVTGRGALLDIDHCVILNGGDPDLGTGQGALNLTGCRGNVINNTICGNTVGVRVYAAKPNAVRIKNNIIVNNSSVGVLWQIGCDPEITYNDCWGNGGYGNYAMDCG